MFGTPDELRAAGIGGQLRRARDRRQRGLGHRIRLVTLSLLRAAADWRMATALAALILVLVGATLILHAVYWLPSPSGQPRHISLLSAGYFAVETVTTVGYGDFSFRGQDPWLMAGAIGLMLLGATFVAVFFAMLTNMIVSRRIEESLGRQRITGLSGHVIVIGLGTVGTQVIQTLVSAGRDVVAVDKNEGNRRLSQLRALRVPVVVASDDLANLETGLAVRDQTC